jgi:hypothetical protein
MKQLWEYKLISLPGGDTSITEDASMQQRLNELGIEGWRLLPLALTGGLGIMERELCTLAEVV